MKKLSRVALDFGIFRIYWYSIFILLGIVIASLMIYKELKKQHISKELFIDMAFYTITLGIIGARLYYVAFHLSYYLKNPIEILEIWNGGLAIHGALLFGFFSILYFCKKNQLDTLKMIDIMVPGVIIGQAIGRWGNFFNQEAFGPLTTYASLKEKHIPLFIIQNMKIAGNYYTPTFLYESLWDLLGFIILLFIRKQPKLKIGQLTGTYLFWYSFGRFFIEELRTDSLMLGNIKMAQLVSMILLIVGIFLIFKNKGTMKYYHQKEKRKENGL